ncbi:MAG: Fic family protein [Sulfuricurvum sp.]
MTFTPIAPLNLKGEFDDDLLQWSERICMKSAVLSGGLNHDVLDEVRELLRITNSYYSNRIESDGTHPINIEKAMRKEFLEEENSNKLQKLSIAHIHTQREIERLIPESSPFDSDFIRFVHRDMYTQDGMEKFLNIQYPQTGEIVKMVPGEFRTRGVAVGGYVAPPSDEVTSLMSEYANQYKISFNLPSVSKKFLYALASHHRLVWVHPFLDGNGRVSRLVLDGAIIGSGLHGYGLWNISRGLARNVDDYKKYLKHADMKRQGTYDGKGELSAAALREFVIYMLKTAEDQIDYMGSLLRMDGLANRIESYVAFANSGTIGIGELPKGTASILKHLLVHGESSRGSMAKVIGAGERTTTNVVQELLRRNFLATPSPKGSIRLRFPAHMASFVFPELLPIVHDHNTVVTKKKPGRPKK